MLDARKVFITGIGGFIGARLAERIDAEVWGIDHDPAAVARAQQRGIRAVQADVNGSLASLMEGADVVIHTAAIVREFGALDEFRRVNVEGSRNVAETARACGVRTFVQLSSVMVYGFDYPDRVGEDGPLRGEDNPYCQTKIESEQAVREVAGLGVIIIRPGDVYGPGSQPWIARPVQMLKKRMLLLPGRSGKINPVYVDNLIDGILLAIERRAHGEAFNISDGIAPSFVDYFTQLARVAGLPGPMVVPVPVMRGLASVMSAARELGLTRDEVSRDTVRTLLRPHAYSIAKAQKLLGYQPRIELAQGLLLTRPFIETQLSLA